MTIGLAAVPNVANLTLTSANTEYTYAFPNGTKHIDLHARTNATIRFAFETGKVATPTAPYASMKPGETWESPPLWGSATITLYAASPTAGTVLEIVSWT